MLVTPSSDSYETELFVDFATEANSMSELWR